MPVAGFAIIRQMAERPHFGKYIEPGKRRGTLVVKEEGKGDILIGKPSKEVQIPAGLLGNLRSLAIIAEGKFNDSMDQDFYNKEIEGLQQKYPNEQPGEVWSRSLATLMKMGVGINDVAKALLNTSMQYDISGKLGAISDDARGELTETIKGEIKNYWPKPKAKK